MFLAPSLAAARRQLVCVGSILDGAYPPKLFPPWQLYRVTTASTLSLLIAASAGFLRALPRASGPFSLRSQPQGFELPRSPLLASLRCRKNVARCSLGLLFLSGRFALVPLSLRAPRSPLRASGSEESSAMPGFARPPKGSSVSPAGAVPFGGSWRSEELQWASQCASGAPKSSGSAPGCADASKPRWVRLASSPKRGGLSGPGPPSLPSEEGRFVEPGWDSPLHPSEEGWVGGSWGKRGWRCHPSEEGWRCRRFVGSAPPKGVGLIEAPVGSTCFPGQAPDCPLFRWASPFRRRSSALHRG
jgi:hypothetical protein